MQKQYDKDLIDDAWILFAHIERKGAWDTERAASDGSTGLKL
ncbi:MAG: hypothetical protein SVZ03_06170 [Spirochaetota bacterium]|nr:hypothetical protein [Spirochaetota bacterium]